MPLQDFDYREGIRLVPPMVSLIANTTPITIHQGFGQLATANPIQVGASSFIIRKVHVFNANGATTRIQFGSNNGGGFVQQMPDIFAVNGQDLELTEDQLPAFEWFLACAVQATVAAAAPNNVLVMIEVEEYPAGTVPV